MECFVILGIEQTDDEQRIRNAYREKLATVNPEYDQEGFMRLRNAYEQALQFAQTSQEEEQEADKGPVDLLIDEFQKVYARMSDRINPEAWKKLLDHPMFDALDLEETAKWSLFAWLAGHWRLPLSIWRLLDSYFFIGEHKAEFMEKLPGGFVEFMLDKLTNEEIVDFPYEEFEPVDQESVNYDAFLESYEEIRRLLEEATVEERREAALREAEQKLEYVETLGVIHPWMQLEKARFLRKADRSREAEDMVRWLLAHYESDVQVYVGCARILKELGYHQEALPLFERLQKMENLPRGVCYYTTFHLAELYEEEGKLEDARKQCLDAHDFFETDEVLQLMTRINNGLIEQWSKIPEELTEKQTQKLAWCYIQTERYEEGLEFIRTHHMLRGEGFRNYRAMAVLLLQTKHPGEALNYCKEWYVRLEATDFTGLEGEDYFSPEEKTESLAQAREMEGRAYRMLAEEASEEEKEALMKKSVEALELGLELNSGDINLLMTRLMLARELEEYEYITELCQRIMKLDAGFYWAYFYAQEAYEKLQKPQEVIDYFYQAKEIYGGHPEIYERVARVFLEFGQVEDASDILRQAEEAGVSSPTLKVFKLQLLRRQVCDRKTAFEADKYAKKTIGELIQEKASDELLAKAYLELAYIQGEEGAKDLGNQKKIARYSRKSIEYKDTVDARYSLGRALFLFEKDAKGALENLKICEEMGLTFCWMYYYMARSCEMLKKWDDAIVYYQRAVEEGPEERDFAWRAAWLYRQKFNRTGQRVYYEKALEYMKLQLERCEADASDYWQLSDLHFHVGEYELALEEIDHALETDQGARNWGHKGQMLELLHRREEAVECYEKGIEAELPGGDYAFAYSQMKDYFLETGKYQEGVLWFERWIPKCVSRNKRVDNVGYLVELYVQLQEYEKAFAVIEKYFGSTSLKEYSCSSWTEEGKRIEELIYIYHYMPSTEGLSERLLEAEALLEGSEENRLESDRGAMIEAYKEIAKGWQCCLMDEESAIRCYERVLGLLRSLGNMDDSDYREALTNLMICNRWLGRPEEAEKYRKQIWQYYDTMYEECKALGMSAEELHANAVVRSKHRMYQLFILAYYAGDYEKAEHYLKKMEQAKWCYHCTHSDCTEYWECLGLMAMHRGEKEEAERFLNQAINCSATDNLDAAYLLMRLKSKK